MNVSMSTDYEKYLNMISRSGIDHVTALDEDYQYIATLSDLDEVIVVHQFKKYKLVDIYIGDACNDLESFIKNEF